MDRLHIYDGLLYNSFSAEQLMEIIENATDEDRKNMDSKVLKQIDELYENLDEESNTTIFLGKFR